MSRAGTPPAGLWAITTYFNPVGYRRRSEDYARFRSRLGLPLVAVELSFDGNFQLSDGDAEILIRVEGGDIMWQKERLLNIALDRLPADCTAIAWLDCDVVFEDAGWAARAVRLLDRFSLVQPFADILAMPPDWQPGDPDPAGVLVRHPAAWHIAIGQPPEDLFTRFDAAHNFAPGYAWMCPRELLHHHRFYDACIAGGGDRALSNAAWGHTASVIERQWMNPTRAAHYHAWADSLCATVKGSVTFIEGRLFHLWHGADDKRAYDTRHRGLADFDPEVDIAIAPSGAWRWASDKPELHRFVRDYFVARREDG